MIFRDRFFIYYLKYISHDMFIKKGREIPIFKMHTILFSADPIVVHRRISMRNTKALFTTSTHECVYNYHNKLL